MLLRFGVTNHRSIRSYQELVLTATTLKDSEVGLLPVLDAEPSGESQPSKALRVVPVVAIYGANAAGKSTLLKAFDFFVSGIVQSHERTASSEGTPYAPFLLDEYSRTQPSQYDADITLGGTRYHYGYSLNGKSIVSEWLYSFPLGAGRQARTVLFHRNRDEPEEFYFGKTLKGDNKRIANLVRPNSLFLSAAAQNAHPTLSPIFEFFFHKISRRMDQVYQANSVDEQVAAYFWQNREGLEQLISFLQAADIGIRDIDFSKIPVPDNAKRMIQDFEFLLAKHSIDLIPEELKREERTKVRLLHVGEGGKSFPISLNYESSGTLSLLQLLGPILSRLQSGGVLVVDELNVTLHPLVARELIKLFSHPVTNPGKGQLIFSTHDTSMLTSGLLRRDQVWFAEKDMDGASTIFPLSSIKVKSTDNIERGYVNGRFGAIPLFGIRGHDVTRFGLACDLDETAR